MRKKRPRKALRVPEEEFFQAAALLCAPHPTWGEINQYAKYFHTTKGMSIAGLAGWLTDTPEGRAFVRLLMEHGEAKSRAWHWYRRFRVWLQAAEGGRRWRNR